MKSRNPYPTWIVRASPPMHIEYAVHGGSKSSRCVRGRSSGRLNAAGNPGPDRRSIPRHVPDAVPFSNGSGSFNEPSGRSSSALLQVNDDLCNSGNCSNAGSHTALSRNAAASRSCRRILHSSSTPAPRRLVPTPSPRQSCSMRISRWCRRISSRRSPLTPLRSCAMTPSSRGERTTRGDRQEGRASPIGRSRPGALHQYAIHRRLRRGFAQCAHSHLASIRSHHRRAGG